MDKRTVPGTMPTLIADLTCAANGSYTENYIRALCERAAEAIKDLESVRSEALGQAKVAVHYARVDALEEAAKVADKYLWAPVVAAEIRALSTARVAEGEFSPFWLIERGQAVNHVPTIWWKGGNVRTWPAEGEDWKGKDWTENAPEARRFRTTVCTYRKGSPP